MTIPYLKENQIPTPEAGCYALFYNADQNGNLYAKDSTGSFTALNQLPGIDTTEIDDCICHVLNEMMDAAGCSLKKGLITATEYQSLINNFNLFSDVNYDPSTGSYTHGITSSPTLFVALTLTNVLCNGESNGTATATISGGVGPYTQAWEDLAGNPVNPAALPAGAFRLIVTDANGTVLDKTFVITEPSALGLSVVVSGTSPTAQATALPTGGTGPYTYEWKDNGGVPIGQTTQTATGLSTGTYQVEVTDANGCTIEDTNVVIP